MYVESFVLTIEPPRVAGGSILLGEVQDGAFTAPAFPARIDFGVLLELALDEDDPPGPYEVDVVLEYSLLPETPQAPIGDSFTITAVDASEGFWGPRLIAQPLEISLRLWDEFEGYLVVRVNGEEIGEKALRVLHYGVPDTPEQGNDT